MKTEMISIILCAHTRLCKSEHRSDSSAVTQDTGNFTLRQFFHGLKLANSSKLADQEAS